MLVVGVAVLFLIVVTLGLALSLARASHTADEVAERERARRPN